MPFKDSDAFPTGRNKDSLVIADRIGIGHAGQKIRNGATLSVDGKVTDTVTGSVDPAKAGTLIAPESSDIKAQGAFLSVTGAITLSGDTTVGNITATRKITGDSSASYALTLLGNEGSKTYTESDFALSGGFKELTIKNVSVTLDGKSGLNVKSELNAENNKLVLKDGVRVGTDSDDECASGTLKNATVEIENCNEIYARLTGDANGSNALHVDANTAASTSRIGLRGVYDSVTGKAYVCGDLTIRSTAEAAGETVYGNELILVGGMKLASDVDDHDVVTAAGFSGIAVDDTHSDDDFVTLAMYEETDAQTETNSVNIGAKGKNAASEDMWEPTALEVTGDSKTVVTLRTNDIYGNVNGVVAVGKTEGSQPTVTLVGTLTGDTKSDLIGDEKTTEATYAYRKGNGVAASNAVVSLTNYAVSAVINGAALSDAADVTVTNVTVTGTEEAAVDAADSTLTLNAVNAFTGAKYGIKSSGSTVTGAADSSGTVTATASSSENPAEAALNAVNGSTVTLTNYNIGGNSTGVYTEDESAAADAAHTAVSLSYTPSAGTVSGTNYGMIVGGKTTVTLDTARVSGDTAAKVDGSLLLKGGNVFAGVTQGVVAQNGGKVTNVGDDLGGSGSITSSGNNSTTLIVSGEGTEVTLSDYSVVPATGSTVTKWAINATDKCSVTLTATQAQTVQATNCAVNADNGATVRIDGAENNNFKIINNSTSNHTVEINKATVYLGRYTEVNNNAPSNGFDIDGVEDAALYVAKENADTMTVRGQFVDLTGQHFVMCNDLTVAATSAATWDGHTTFADEVSLLGKSYNLEMGTVKATIQDGSELKSFKVAGTSSNQSAVTVAGSLTVSNGDHDYGIQATYTDLTLSDPAKALNVTASKTGAAALDFGNSAVVTLQGTVNATGNGFGMKLTGTAKVKNAEGQTVSGKIIGAAALYMAGTADLKLAGAPEPNAEIKADVDKDYALAFIGRPQAAVIDGTATAEVKYATAKTLEGENGNIDVPVVSVTSKGSGVTFDTCKIRHVDHPSTAALVYAKDGKATFINSIISAKTNGAPMALDGTADVTLNGTSVRTEKSGEAAVTVGKDALLDVKNQSELSTKEAPVQIALSGAAWIEDVKSAVAVSGAGDAAKLYINPALADRVTVNGAFAAITGTAKIAETADLTIRSTADARIENVSTANYANGTTTANNTFKIVGGGNASAKVTQKAAENSAAALVSDVTVENGTIGIYNKEDGVTTFSGGTVTAFAMDAGKTYIKDSAAIGSVDMKDGTTVMTGGSITGTGVQLNGSMWIVGAAQVNGTVVGRTGASADAKSANLYVNTELASLVTVDGTFTNITGAAKLAETAALVIYETKDAKIENKGTDYANKTNGTASTTPYDEFRLVGGGGDTATVTQKAAVSAGTALTSKVTVDGGTIKTYTKEDGVTIVSGGTVKTLDMAKGTTEVKNTGKVGRFNMADGATTISGGEVGSLDMKTGTTVMEGGKITAKDAEGGDVTDSVTFNGKIWIKSAQQVSGTVRGLATAEKPAELYINPTLKTESGTGVVTVDGTFTQITGVANIAAAANLTIDNTKDATVRGGESYTNGATANNHFEIAGGGGENAAVTQKIAAGSDAVSSVTVSGGKINQYDKQAGTTVVTGTANITTFDMAKDDTTVSGGIVGTLNMADGKTTVSGGQVVTFNMTKGETTISENGRVWAFNMTDGKTEITGNSKVGNIDQKNGTIKMTGGSITAQDKNGNAMTPSVQMNGSMWIVDANGIEGTVFGRAVDSTYTVPAKLYINPALKAKLTGNATYQLITVNGTFENITGVARLDVSASLTINGTKDAKIENSDSAPYAGGATANNHFELVGGGGENAAVTQTIDSGDSSAVSSVTVSGGEIKQYDKQAGTTVVTGTANITTFNMTKDDTTVSGGKVATLNMADGVTEVKDTGKVGEGLNKLCGCALKKLQEELKDGARINSRETFAAFDPAVFPNEEQRGFGVRCRGFCEKYVAALPHPEKPNLLFLGAPGLGKSYFANAIAYGAIERGIETRKVTAYRFLSDRLDDIANGTDSLRFYTSVPLLVLDDLGTEPIVPNVTKETLFSVLNERIASRLPTITVTNLMPEALSERYDERIVSRLTDKSVTSIVTFRGTNLRTR